MTHSYVPVLNPSFPLRRGKDVACPQQRTEEHEKERVEDKEGRRHERCKAVSWLVNLCLLCPSTWEVAHRDWSSSLSISPGHTPPATLPRPDPTGSCFVVAQPTCEIQTTSSPPPGFGRRRDKNRDMDNRGSALASTSHPRFELPVPVLAIHPHHSSSPLLPLPAASITTPSGPIKVHLSELLGLLE